MISISSVTRDLEWAIQSPPLCFSHPPLFEQWSNEGAVPTVATMATKGFTNLRRPPIGRYFEQLIGHWLGAQTSVANLEMNIPIHDGSRTLGELDMIFEVDKKIYHWELALKFYLGVKDRSQPQHWFGPLGRDRLDLKLAKLQHHQLRLPKTPAGSATLAKRGISSISSHALMKGYLFHPFVAWQLEQRVVPPDVNPEHGHGFWIHVSDARQLCEVSQHWQILTKADWLAQAQCESPMTPEQLLAQLHTNFAADSRPPMLAALHDDGSELARGFVVPDTWSPESR